MSSRIAAQRQSDEFVDAAPIPIYFAGADLP